MSGGGSLGAAAGRGRRAAGDSRPTGETRGPQRPTPREQLATFVLSDRVQNFILAIILLNAVTLGLQTSPAIVVATGPLLPILDNIALGIFIIEIVVKLVALGWRYFRDGWNVFDFLVVAIALIPAAGPFAVLRALRVLRVLRLVNRMPQLRRIATAIIRAIPGIGAIAALMAIIFYVAAVMATTLFGRDFPEWFGSVPASLYSLFQVMTLESWSMGIVRPVMEAHPEAWAFFVPFILVSAFVMLNLFVAVIIDTMSNLDDDAPPPPADQPARMPVRDVESQAELVEVRRELREVRAALERLTASLQRDER